ncbi:magnesium transporter [Anaerotruncus sp. CAG:390]|nr:magnesium transporter [Anaerotruncus sp. CAG:390]
MKENFIFTETLRTLIEEKKYQSLRDVLLTAQPVDLAAALAEMPPQDLSLLFRLLPKDEAADTFVEMDADSREELIRGFSDSELRDILNELYLDDTVDLIEEVPALLVGRILEQSSPESRRLINELLRYPDDSAGSIMTTEYVGLHAAMTVGEAIEHIRRVGIDSENINVCYVTDRGRRLIGIVTIRTLILAEPGASVGSVMNENIISVRTLDDKEDVANVFTKYGSIVLPVVDSEERLVGIVTVDDVMNVIRDEATEDIDKIGAVTPSDKPYMKLSVLEIFKNRIPWLLVLTVSAAFTGSIITHFQDALSSYLVLVAAIPMLMDTGGNCGSQSSVTVIRGISLGEIAFGDIFRVMWKEARVSVLCGVTLAALNFAKLMLINRVGFGVAAVICLTLIVTVFAAKLVGCTLPLIAKKAGLDPAVMASPFITTIVDALSLFIYFRMAGTILGI